jgi:murein DD-endopeptidase MepM/ murein hydrolase activator NlpD
MIKALGFKRCRARIYEAIRKAIARVASPQNRHAQKGYAASKPTLPLAVVPAAQMWSQLVPVFIVIQLFSLSGSVLAQQPETLPKTSTKLVAQRIETSRDQVESTAPQPAIASPIRGVKASELRDSFNEMHNGQRHEAIDISEPEGMPVRAVVDGTIQKLFFSKAGGNTIYEFDRASVYCYYYAHLERFADGLQDGMPVSRGEVIGYVGSTGNVPCCSSPALRNLSARTSEALVEGFSDRSVSHS